MNTGVAPEASTIPVPEADADRAFDAAACPKGITVDYIAKMNREYLGATVTYAEKVYGKD